MTTKLVEEYNVYIDDESGDEYVWDGSQLVLVKKGSKQIGDKGSEEIQAKEEAERAAQAAKEGIIETEEQKEARLKEIEAALNNTEFAKELTREATDRVAKEKLKKEYERSERELKKFRSDPVVQFKDSLNHFLKKQMKREEKRTFGRINRRYDGSDFIVPGKKRYDKPDVPTVQVYFDRSGSWDESKTKIGRQALSTLDKYVRQGKLKVNISYFNDKVFDYYTERGSGGTYGSPILINIQAKKPDNVVIMTDSDISDCRENVEVPGVVWFLFVDGVSYNLMEHLRGKTGTIAYEMSASDYKD